MPFFIKGFHVYRNVRLSVLDEELYGEMDPSNLVDKYDVAVRKENSKNGKLTRTIFYFLKMQNNRD